MTKVLDVEEEKLARGLEEVIEARDEERLARGSAGDLLEDEISPAVGEGRYHDGVLRPEGSRRNGAPRAASAIEHTQ